MSKKYSSKYLNIDVLVRETFYTWNLFKPLTFHQTLNNLNRGTSTLTSVIGETKATELAKLSRSNVIVADAASPPPLWCTESGPPGKFVAQPNYRHHPMMGAPCLPLQQCALSCAVKNRINRVSRLAEAFKRAHRLEKLFCCLVLEKKSKNCFLIFTFFFYFHNFNSTTKRCCLTSQNRRLMK